MIPSAALVVVRFVFALVRLCARAWPGRGSRAAAWSAVIAFAACGAWSPAAAAPLTWNPAADFYATTTNPNGVWSYGWMDTSFSTFTPYVNKSVNPAGYSNWYGWAGDQTPAVGFNGQTVALNGVPAGAMVLHPGTGNEPSVLRWTAPFAATIRAVGQFYAGDGGVMQVAVRHNNSALFTASDAGAFDRTVTVAVGDRIDFTAFGGYAFGSTGLTTTISIVSVPLPLTTADTNKLSLGAFPGGAVIQLAVTGAGEIAGGAWPTNPDGSLASVASVPYAYANAGSAFAPVAAFPAGDGVNRFVGGGANYDYAGTGWPFAGKQTTDSTDPAAIRFGAVVGTFASSPTRSDWFLIGTARTIVVPSGGATLSLAVNESASTNNTGTYTVTVATVAPANDAFSSAVALAGLNHEVFGANVSATKESAEPSHAGNTGGASAWWKWTAPRTGVASVSTIGSSFDTLLGIYTGAAVNTLTAVASDDNSGPANASKLTFNATAGTVYAIAVDGKNSGSGAATGSITLHVGYAYQFSTFAGLAGTVGSTNATGSAARFSGPNDVVIDSAGNLYVGESVSHTIRKITPTGVVTTLAGSAGLSGTADGTGADARFKQPLGLALDGSGNILVADYENHAIRRVTPAGVVTTLAGLAGTAGFDNAAGTAARFNFPVGLVVDSTGNIFVADSANHVIRKIEVGGAVTTFAGTMGISGSADGAGITAKFNTPYRLALDSSGHLYVADTFNHTIRKITPAGVVTTLAGTAGAAGIVDGAGLAAKFNKPYGLALDATGNLFTADYLGHTLRKITPSGVVTTLAGLADTFGAVDGIGAAARFREPTGVALNASGHLFIGDFTNQTIRRGALAIPPAVNSLSPSVVYAGATATLTGTGFLGATAVSFNGTPATAFTVVSDTTLTAVVPVGATAGNVTVTAPGGTSTVTAAFTVITVSPTALDGFAPNGGGGNANVTQVLAAALQADGKIIIGGNFTTLQPAGTAAAVNASRLARLNRDGTIDSTFAVSANAEVSAVAVQPDGKILVAAGGQINGVNTGNLARLNSDGSRDNTFTFSGSGAPRKILVLPDGKLLVAGGFSNGSIRYPVLRLLADGSLDPTFTRVPITGVLSATLTWAYDVVVQADGKMLVGGYFWTIGGQGIRMLARLNADGTLDPAFDAGLTHGNGPDIKRIVLQPDGKILIAGRFASVAGQNWTHFARLHPDGTLDTTFPALTGVNFSGMADCALQADGRIVVVGGFNSLNGISLGSVVRLLPDGTVDPTLTGGVGNTGVEFPTVLVSQPDGSVLVGGGFATLGGLPLGRLARIQPDGTIERTLALDATAGVVGAFALQPNGKLLLGGHFDTVGGVSRPFVARLNPDATLDTTFNPAPNASVIAPVVLADGRFLLGGRFSTIGGLSRNGLARFSADGVIDPAFDAAIAGGTLNSVVLQSDGKIVIGGTFTSAGGQSRNRLARLNADGSLDTAFNPDVKGEVFGLALQGDGSIVFSGDFTQVGGTTRNRLARVNSAGVLDGTFDPAANNTVHAVAVQADGKLLVTGFFTTIAGETRAGYARLTATGAIDAAFNPATTAGGVTVVQADGKILVGGVFTSMAGAPRGYLARLLGTGAIDADFNVAGDGHVGALALQSDGKILVGGDFSNIGGQARLRLARLNSTGPTSTALTATPSVITLTRTGPLPELSWVTLEKSTDRTTWTSLGTATRIGTTANWQLTGQTLPTATLFYLRARAAAPTGVYGASSLVEHVQQIYVAPFEPKFTTQPVAYLSANVGASATFTVAASATAGVTYQWRKFGQPIAGANTATLTVPNLTLGDAGLYDVVVTTIGVGFPSTASRLDVQAPIAAATLLTASPAFAARFENDFAFFERSIRTPDGKVYVSGNFSSLFGVLRPGFARLDAAGTLDTAFAPAPVKHHYNTPRVYAVAAQADGRIVIGGRFDAVGGHDRDGLARLNPDGTLDPTFVPPANLTNSDRVLALALQPDGKILVAGSFNDSGVNLARLHPDGSRDTTFVAGEGFNGSVYALALQADGKIVVGGNFYRYKGTDVGYLVRLSATGALDTAYKTAGGAGFNLLVNDLVLQPDGKLLVGGNFTSYGGSPRARLVRLLETGALDTTFSIGAGFDNDVAQLALQSDGAVIVTGNFKTFDGNSTEGIVRLTAAGARDTTFVTSSELDASPGFNDGADGVALLANGVLVLSNDSTRYASPVANTGPLTRLTALGALDPAFAPVPRSAGSVAALIPAPGGKWLVGGQFSRVNGTPRGNLARLNSDFTLDHDFIPSGAGFGGPVKTLAVQPDGRVLVGGSFATFNNLTANRLVRLTPAGPLDTTFDVGTGFDSEVSALALDSSGRVLAGGQFTSFNGTARNKLLRLTATGAVDPAFAQTGVGLGNSADVSALAVLPDGRVYVGGSFSAYAGTACYNVARFLADGVLDSTFASGLDAHRVNSRVTSLIVQPDGKLLLGGQFYGVGNFYTNGLARLNADASRDPTFGAFETYGDVTALRLQSDGRVVVAGDFEQYGYGDSPLMLPHLVRLSATGVIDPAFRVPGFSGSPTVLQADATGALLVGGGELLFPGRVAAGLARLDAAVLPTIVTAPAQQAVAAGAPAAFSVTATGGGLAYQWTKDGFVVPGANGSALPFAAAQPADVGHYAVTVKNIFGSVTSTPVLLTGTGSAPSISALTSATVTVGSAATLTVTATGATSYQWRKLGQPITGNTSATTATLTLPATVLADAGHFDVLAYNGLTRTRSAVARLVVQPSGSIQNPLRVDRTFAGVLESIESYGQPNRILAQPDGSYYVAGSFTSVGGAFRFNLARFSATGVLDPAFTPEVSGGSINALARQADGKLLLVGDFHRVNGLECHHIARLNTDGTLDTTFVHGHGTGTQESLRAVAIQADQKILIGGDLSGYGSTFNLPRFARLNTDGTLDDAFNTALQGGFNDTVRAIAVHTDGRIYVVGDFTQFNGSSSANHVLALNADGTRFALPGIEAGAFATEQSALPALGSANRGDGVELTSLIVQPDGKLVVAGNFTTFRNTTARYLVGLAADGSADPSFINGSGADSTVTQIIRQADGVIYLTGHFNTFNSRSADLVRLTATGSFDRAYSFDGTPAGLALGAGNDLLVVGDFQTHYDSNGETSTARSRFARFNAAGALTSAQVTRWGTFQGYVQTIIPAPGGKWLVAGYFRRLAGARVDYLARLNADGSFDSTFSTVQGPFGTPSALAVQGDGKILVGGSSEYWGNDEVSERTGRLVRLHPDGTRDTSFNRGHGFNDYVSALLVQPDGKIVVGGDFTAFDGQPVGARLARLHPDGSLDTSFLTGTGFDQSVRALALQSDDKLLVGGDFLRYHSATDNVTRLVRLHANGVLETAYAVSGDRVSAIAQQADGAFLIGGSFHTFAGQARSGVARLTSAGAFDPTFNTAALFVGPESLPEINALAVQPDGRVIVSGYFQDLADVSGTGQLARLTPTGALDQSFRPYFGGSIYALALRADGGLLLAGGELYANETYRQGLLALGGSTVTAAPVITTPPVAVVATSGTTATFSVTAAGDGLTYQWRRYGVPIPGATNATLHLPAVTLASADVYDVVIANPTGAFGTSTPVPLAVSPVVTPGALVLDDRFDLPFEREMSAIESDAVTQVQALPGGKFLVAGGFTRIAGVPRSRLARFHADGTVDLTFVPPAINAPVSRFVVQPDGKIVIAGSFYRVGPSSSGGLARLHADGALDAAFPSASVSNVDALALQADGKILVGGQISSIGGGLTRPGVARFTAAGVPDASFDAGLNTGAVVRAIALQTLDSAEKILLGGTFTTVGGVTRNNLARVTLTGALDAAFSAATANNGPDGQVNAILAVDTAGAVVIGGAFATVNGVAAPRLARLAAADGALDSAFLSSVSGTVNGEVHALALQPSGDLVVAGSFTAFSGGAARLRVARVNLSGLVDAAFAPTANNAVSTLSLQADGAILLGGSFNQINGMPRQHLARLSSLGVADPAVDPTLLAPAGVLALVHASGGGVLVGGSFTHVGGVPANALVRLGASGQLDATFNAGSAGFPKGAVVTALAPVGDGRVTVIGFFASYNGTARPHLLRLDASGALDSVFAPPNSLSGSHSALVALPGGRVLLAGSFAAYNGVTRNGLAVLNNDASLDSTFAVPPSQIPFGGLVLARQPDGKILIGGNFTTYAGTAVNRLVRLNVDGTLDTAFLTAVGTGPNLAINALQPLPDGRLIVAGGFTTWNGNVGSTYAVRLLATGELDSAFQVQATGFGIVSLLLQADGKLIERGLSSVSGTGPNSAFGFGRLTTAGSADNSFFVTGVAGFNSGDRAMLQLDDGNLLVAGNATLNLGGPFQRQGLARLIAFVGPAIVTPPAAQTVAAGGTATFSVVADGGAVNLYQWFRGTTLLTGANTPVLVLKNITTADAGDYTVQITNARGTVTSTPVALTVNDLPAITTQPVAQSAVFGGSATFSVVATGSPTPTYQWQRNGVDIPSATGSSYAITSASQDQAGAYRVVVTNSVGFVRSEPAEFAVVTRNLINFYARAIVAPRGTIVTSFTVEGTQPKTVLLVGVGGTRASTATFSGGTGGEGIPAGRSLAVPPSGLTDPRLVVVNAAGALIGSNDNWTTTNVSALTAASTQVGATPGLTSTGEGANDAALLLTLAPGTYHVTLDSADAAGGAALLQVYDADTDGRPRLVMFTLRANVGSGDNVATAGFTLDGKLPKTVLIRALGEGLGFSPGILVDPVIELFRGPAFVARNDDTYSISDPAVAVAVARVGARPVSGSLDSTLLQTLDPGVYTVQLTPYYSGESGTVLFELFETDAQRAATIAPVITYLSPDQRAVQGRSAWFGVTVVAKPGATYQWRRNGSPIDGAVHPVLSLSDVQSGDATSYDVVITSGGDTITSQPRTLAILPEFHSADTDRDRRLGLLELTRIIQFYNHRVGTVRTGEYRTLADTEDGFTLGAGAITTHHSADSNRDGRIDIVELTRLIELFNHRSGTARTGEYHAAVGTEDGFMPGPEFSETRMPKVR